MKTKPMRPSADLTREKILEAAKSLFMRHGFDGTSLNQIAELANINQSLISHHFGNKQMLWVRVKEALIQSAKVESVNPQPESLRAFLLAAVAQRLGIYEQKPELLRLISWQRLENLKEYRELDRDINQTITPMGWEIPLQYLQQKKMLNKNIQINLALVWIVTSINGIILDDFRIFNNNEKNKEHYIQMIVDGLEKSLR